MHTEEIRIMILGAGIMQIPALQIARLNGWQTLCVDGDPQAPGRELADEFHVVDLKDKEALFNLARKVREERGLGGVFTAGTDFSASVAFIAENLGLPGIRYETAMNATDKVRMRECFHRAGVPSPLFFDVSGELPEAALKMKFPVVVKPVDNMGARGVIRIDEPNDLPGAVKFALPYSRTGRVIVEEFIPGPEYSLDAIVYHGEVFITGFADRHIYFPPYFVELGHTMPTQAPMRVQRAVEAVFRQGIRALGIENGAAKGDIKWDGHRAVVGEIAARLSGGFMSGWTYPRASGYSSIEAAMKIALGHRPDQPPIRYPRHAAERAFLSIPGVVSSIHLPESCPGDLHLRIKPGDRVVFPRNNVEKCGNIIVSGTDRHLVISQAEKTVASLLVRLCPEDSETAAFLNGPEEWIPQPFKGLSYAASRFRKRVLAGGPVDFRVLPRPNCRPVLPLWKNWESEKASDWNGQSLTEALRLLLEITARSPVAAGDFYDDPFFRWFWKAFFTGSLQGGLWFLDTCRGVDPLS